MHKFCDKSVFTCFALTEQTGGTGATCIPAVKDADGNYILNGEKWLISHTDVSQFAYVIAVTDPEDRRRAPVRFLRADGTLPDSSWFPCLT